MVHIYIHIWYIITQRDREMSCNVAYQAILGLVYAGTTILVTSTNPQEWTPTNDNHKLAAQWSLDRRGSETRLSAPASIRPHHTALKPLPTPPPAIIAGMVLERHRRPVRIMALNPAKSYCRQRRIVTLKCQTSCASFLNRCILDALCS